ncbi:MAG TPA: NUDIX hydrolase [Paracoccaceae bacterium]|nr:NUDIX hydrolase [Paracoccaceae bacterium]
MKRSPTRNFVPDPGGRRTQCGALCWRHAEGEVQVLLVTSRDTGRWVIPKGWPIDGLDMAGAALREAWEEAGVRGAVDPAPLGWYSYDKVLRRGPSGTAVPCIVAVHPLQVTQQENRFPEAKERRRMWFGLAEAATRVDEPELSALIAGFRPPVDVPDGA